MGVAMSIGELRKVIEDSGLSDSDLVYIDNGTTILDDAYAQLVVIDTENATVQECQSEFDQIAMSHDWVSPARVLMLRSAKDDWDDEDDSGHDDIDVEDDD